LQELDSANLLYASKLTESLYRIDLDENETPEDLRIKFSDNNGNAGVFAFIFSSIDPNDGLACRHLQSDLNKFDGIANGTYKITGTPVVRATFLDLVLKNINKTLALGFVLIAILLLLYYNRFSRTIFTLLPSIFAMGWLVFLLRMFNMEISAYNSLAFPILFAFSVDGSIQLWTAYYEKQGGTALNILQRKFFTVGISQLASLIGTYGLLISSHPGLRSIGQICLLGLICISVSQFTIFPLIAGSLDNYRLHKQKKS
jgi:predicted RND superfamily exporter protein